MKKLLVRAAGTAMVANIEALDAGARRFIGREFDSAIGVAGGWKPLSEPVEIPDRAEYRKAVKDGDLEAADEETARVCQVSFVAHDSDKKD